jgi:hypothetical protein
VQDVVIGKLSGGTLSAQKLDELPAPDGTLSLSIGTQSLRLTSLGGNALLALWYRPATVEQGSSPTRWARFDETFAPSSAERSMVFRVDQPDADKTGNLTSTPLTAGGAPDLFAHGLAWGPSAVADEAGGVVLVYSFWPAGPPGISGHRYIAGQGWTAPVRRVVQTPTVLSWAIATRTTDGSTTVIVLPDSGVAVSRLQSVRFVPSHP